MEGMMGFGCSSKKILISCAIVSMLTGNALGAMGADEPQISAEAQTTFVSRYIWRGQDLYPSNDGAFQPQVTITADNVLSGISATLDVWASYATANGHETADELDYTFLFSREFNEDTIAVSAGYTYFDYPNLNDTSDAMEAWLSLDAKIPGCPLDSSLLIFAGYDFAAAGGGPDEGWYFSLGIFGLKKMVANSSTSELVNISKSYSLSERSCSLLGSVSSSR